MVEALAEWVLSKNLQPKENIANYYIQKVKEKRDDLDRINQAIKRYNQALDYCYQRCEDLAVMQLKKAIEAGAKEFIQKPLDQQQVITTVNRFLEGR